MKTDLLEYREKLSHYNRWEDEQRSTRSINQKLQEFQILFNLAEHIPAKEVMQQQKHHLENLVALQARLMAAGREARSEERREKRVESGV